MLRARLKKKKIEEDEQFGSFDEFQFGTSAMVASDFDGLGGYRTLESGTDKALQLLF